MSHERKRCAATTKAGTPCKNWARAEGDFCHVHHHLAGEETAVPTQPAPFQEVVAELNELAQKLQAAAPDYAPPPFSPEAFLRLLRQNAQRLKPDMPTAVWRDLQASLQGASAQDFMDRDTWKGMWFILNYSVKSETKSLLGGLSSRVSALPGMNRLASLPGVSTLAEVQGMLTGSSPKDFVDPDTWKGMWYILNYSLKYEAGEMKRRILGDETAE